MLKVYKEGITLKNELLPPKCSWRGWGVDERRLCRKELFRTLIFEESKSPQSASHVFLSHG